MKRLLAVCIPFILCFSFMACRDSSGNDAEPGEKKHEEEEHGHTNVATLTEQQIRTIGIQLGSIEQKELTHSIKANGILTVPNQNKAFVAPLYGGTVRALYVQPGSPVKQGQAIAIIVNPDLLQMQQRLQQLNAQIALAETELKRQQELVAGNAAPLKRLQQVETDLATLKTQRQGFQKQLQAIGASEDFSSVITVRAPISGTVSKVSAQLGSNVDVSMPIAEIVNNSQLHLDLYIYEKDLYKLKPDQTIHFTLTNSPGKEYDAKIYSVGTAFESDSKTIPVHAKVMGDKAGLIDGMNITALVSLDKSTVPAVPNDAIVTYQGQDYIFIVKDGGGAGEDLPDTDEHGKSGTDSQKKISFERIPIARGNSDIGYTEITLLKQVPARSRIVDKGAFFILAKMTNSEDDGH